MAQNNMNDKEIARLFSRDDVFVKLQMEYPLLYKISIESPVAAIYALKKKGAISIKCGDFQISANFGGDTWSNKKSWENYKTGMQAQVEKLVHDVNHIGMKMELSKAREEICLAIYNSHFKVLPDWPSTTRTGHFELSASGNYVVNNLWILWKAVGFITVKETPTMTTYNFGFSGNPEIKLVMIDMLDVQNVERLLTNDFDSGKKLIMDSAEEAGLIAQSFDFLKN